MKKAKVIAEIGCTHVGNLDRAKILIALAASHGADIVKFQKRNPLESVPKEWHNKPHPRPEFAYGETYLSHRQNVELDQAQMAELKDYTEREAKIEWSTSVFDITSAKEMIELDPKTLKIPSAQNCNFALLEYVFENFAGDIFISLGMVSVHEKFWIEKYLADKKEKVVVFHCTSAYPCPFNKLYLKEIDYIKAIFPRVGFSDHSLGIAAPIAAYALGAEYIEKHFTDDRCFPHTDSAASLEPGGLQKLRRDLDNIYKAIADKPQKLDKLELEQRRKLRGN